MSSYVGEGEYGKKETKGKDFYELKRGLVPAAPGKELFENKPVTNGEVTRREVEELEDYAGRLLLVGV